MASKLRVTPRYVQKLLHDTGSSFTERVLELRLQKARAMIASPHHDRLMVREIASTCGFNEVSTGASVAASGLHPRSTGEPASYALAAQMADSSGACLLVPGHCRLRRREPEAR